MDGLRICQELSVHLEGHSFLISAISLRLQPLPLLQAQTRAFFYLLSIGATKYRLSRCSLPYLSHSIEVRIALVGQPRKQ